MQRTSRVLNRFPPELNRLLKSYVYLYSDPKNGQPFYLGKGKRNRAFVHLKDTQEREKTLRIKAIRDRGQQPQINLLCYGLSDDLASLVEASAIALLGRPPLVNLVGGEFTMGFGRRVPHPLRFCRTQRVGGRFNSITTQTGPIRPER